MKNINRLSLATILFLPVLITCTEAFTIPRESLPNGLRIIAHEDRRLPMVCLRFVVRSGSSADPAGSEGLANLVGTLLTRGTATRTALAINQEIEYLGGQLAANTDLDHTFIDLKVLSKDLTPALELLTDIVLHPAFNESEFERAREELRGEVRRRADEPLTLLYNEVYYRLFDTLPYGHPVIGYDSTLRRLTRSQVIDFYDLWYVPNNSYLVAVGDFSSESLLAMVEAQFGAWGRRTVPKLADPGPMVLTKSVGRVITRKDMNQAYIFVGNYGSSEGAPDIFAARLMNYCLGAAGTSSRVGQAIREQRGLAYDARTRLDRWRFTGAFGAVTQTRTDSALTAIRLILAEFERMRSVGVSKNELRRAQDYFVGSFPLSYQGISDKISLFDRAELYCLPDTYLDDFDQNINGVTPESVLAAARKYIPDQYYLLVVVGNLTSEDLGALPVHWLN